MRRSPLLRLTQRWEISEMSKAANNCGKMPTPKPGKPGKSKPIATPKPRGDSKAGATPKTRG